MTDIFDWDGVLVLVDNDPEMALMMLQNFLESERGTFDKIVCEVRFPRCDLSLKSFNQFERVSCFLFTGLKIHGCRRLGHVAQGRSFSERFLVLPVPEASLRHCLQDAARQ
jgi:hypothetical protein